MRADLLEIIDQEIVPLVAIELRRYELKRDAFPYLTSTSGRKRMDAVHSGKGVERVNLPGAIKRFVKQSFASFDFINADSDEHHFQHKLSTDVAVSLDFERVHHFGMGKTYTVWLGVQTPGSPGTGLRHNLLSFFDRRRMDWCYATAEELKACLEETRALLSLALPAFKQISHQFIQMSAETSGSIKTTTNDFDFHQAAKIAFRALAQAYPGFSQITSASFTKKFSGKVTGFPRQDRVWRLEFVDEVAERVMSVSIWPSGRLAFELGNMLYVRQGDVMRQAQPKPYTDELLAMPPSLIFKNFDGSPETSSLPEIVSSTEVLDIVDRCGGSKFIENLSDYFLELHYRVTSFERHSPTWLVSYRAARGQPAFTAELNARDGQPIGDVKANIQ